MSKGAVSLRHFVSFVALADHHTLIGAGVANLIRESDVHRRAAATASGIHDPAHRKGFLAIQGNFERHMVGGSTDAAALHLNAGLGVFDGAIENLNRIHLLGAFIGAVNRRVDDALGESALPLMHHFGHELRNDRTVVTSVTPLRLAVDSFSSGHRIISVKC